MLSAKDSLEGLGGRARGGHRSFRSTAPPGCNERGRRGMGPTLRAHDLLGPKGDPGTYRELPLTSASEAAHLEQREGAPGRGRGGRPNRGRARASGGSAGQNLRWAPDHEPRAGERGVRRANRRGRGPAGGPLNPAAGRTEDGRGPEDGGPWCRDVAVPMALGAPNRHGPQRSPPREVSGEEWKVESRHHPARVEQRSAPGATDPVAGRRLEYPGGDASDPTAPDTSDQYHGRASRRTDTPAVGAACRAARSRGG
jgi:hypothetical protein